MCPVSDAFKNAIIGSHVVESRAFVRKFDNSEVLLNDTDLQIKDGSVTVDRSAAVRRRCNLTLVDQTGAITPDSHGSPLAPFGNEIWLERGVVFPDGTTEFVPLGVFMFEIVNVAAQGAGYEIQISGYDRALRVQRARFTDTYTVAAGTNYDDAIKDIISAIGLSPTEFSFTTPRGSDGNILTSPLQVYDAEADRWDAAQKMASACGMELFFDQVGKCVLRPEPDPDNDDFVWQFASGVDSTMLAIERDWDTERTYSQVIVTGESTDVDTTIPRSVVSDTNQQSPTYINGPFGVKPYFYKSPLITTQAQADTAAASTLRRVSGSYESIKLDAIVNPALEAGDTVRVSHESSQINVYGRYAIESFTVPLVAGGVMDLQTRARQLS